MTDKRVRVLCAWCLAEGKTEEAATIGWTETFDGKPSHGICTEHFNAEIAKMDAEDAKEKGRCG